MEESIRMMTERLAQILSANVPSIYLFGSVVLDDFKLGWSDIDIACFVEKPLTENQAQELVMLRQTLLAEYPGNQYFRLFEGIIMTWDACAHHEKGTVVYWGTSGQRILDAFIIDVFSTIELLNYGELLYGEDRRELLQIPSHQEIRQAVKEHLDTIRKYAKQTGESLYSAGWMLDIARCLYTLQTDDVISKTKAGYWAMMSEIAPEPDVLKRAIQIRENPMAYKNDDATKKWLTSLEPNIQLFANVLEDALGIE